MPRCAFLRWQGGGGAEQCPSSIAFRHALPAMTTSTLLPRLTNAGTAGLRTRLMALARCCLAVADGPLVGRHLAAPF
jgi:hypothetical protein